MYAQAFKVGMRAPDDVSEGARLLDQGAFRAEHVVAILGKTEGNGGVNDYTRALATLSFQLLIAERTGQTKVVAKEILQMFLDEVIRELAQGNRLISGQDLTITPHGRRTTAQGIRRELAFERRKVVAHVERPTVFGTHSLRLLAADVFATLRAFQIRDFSHG